MRLRCLGIAWVLCAGWSASVQAQPVFRSVTTAGNGPDTQLIISVPAGVLDDDILIAVIAIEDDVTVTAPGGWTLIRQDDHTGAVMDLYTWWRRAASEPADYTWTFASAWRVGGMLAYSGAITTGDPQDATASGAEGDSTSIVATGITTANDNSMLVQVAESLGGGAYSGGTAPVTNERIDLGGGSGFGAYDGVQATAGASGSKTLTQSITGQYLTQLIAIRAAGGGAAIPCAIALLGVGRC